MDIPLPSDTIFHTIESAIKEYRKFSQKNISNKISDITIDQGMILLYLNKYPELTQKEIAGLVFKDNASMTRMVNLMVKKKYLKRSMNVQDRRRFKLEITSKGKEILVKLSLIISENRSKSLNRITQKELQQLETILNKIKFNLN
ncbi:MarR family transcriptional regulator [Flavobacteriaceae bacterium AH-315-B10]|nr:MarR family transcriptional regulator [Flavobacteriaceae bacterium AH-315-B10]